MLREQLRQLPKPTVAQINRILSTETEISLRKALQEHQLTEELHADADHLWTPERGNPVAQVSSEEHAVSQILDSLIEHPVLSIHLLTDQSFGRVETYHNNAALVVNWLVARNAQCAEALRTTLMSTSAGAPTRLMHLFALLDSASLQASFLSLPRCASLNANVAGLAARDAFWWTLKRRLERDVTSRVSFEWFESLTQILECEASWLRCDHSAQYVLAFALEDLARLTSSSTRDIPDDPTARENAAAFLTVHYKAHFETLVARKGSLTGAASALSYLFPADGVGEKELLADPISTRVLMREACFSLGYARDTLTNEERVELLEGISKQVLQCLRSKACVESHPLATALLRTCLMYGHTSASDGSAELMKIFLSFLDSEEKDDASDGLIMAGIELVAEACVSSNANAAAGAAELGQRTASSQTLTKRRLGLRVVRRILELRSTRKPISSLEGGSVSEMPFLDLLVRVMAEDPNTELQREAGAAFERVAVSNEALDKLAPLLANQGTKHLGSEAVLALLMMDSKGPDFSTQATCFIDYLERNGAELEDSEHSWTRVVTKWSAKLSADELETLAAIALRRLLADETNEKIKFKLNLFRLVVSTEKATWSASFVLTALSETVQRLRELNATADEQLSAETGTETGALAQMKPLLLAKLLPRSFWSRLAELDEDEEVSDVQSRVGDLFHQLYLRMEAARRSPGTGQIRRLAAEIAAQLGSGPRPWSCVLALLASTKSERVALLEIATAGATEACTSLNPSDETSPHVSRVAIHLATHSLLVALASSGTELEAGREYYPSPVYSRINQVAGALMISASGEALSMETKSTIEECVEFLGLAVCCAGYPEWLDSADVDGDASTANGLPSSTIEAALDSSAASTERDLACAVLMRAAQGLLEAATGVATPKSLPFSWSLGGYIGNRAEPAAAALRGMAEALGRSLMAKPLSTWTPQGVNLVFSVNFSARKAGSSTSRERRRPGLALDRCLSVTADALKLPQLQLSAVKLLGVWLASLEETSERDIQPETIAEVVRSLESLVVSQAAPREAATLARTLLGMMTTRARGP